MPRRRRALPVYFISRGLSREAKWTGRRISEANMNYQTLERTIGHSFADIALLDLAMTHPSYALQHKCQDNQRLEFLGDAVLEICVSRVLYHKYPKLREGQLTRKRAALVCEANLARAATRLGLGSYLKLDRGEEVVGGRENPSILADTMEAVIAAVYLDSGMERTREFLMPFVLRSLENEEKPAFKDYKTLLQEIVQKNPEEQLSYELVEERGPDHDKTFTFEVLLNGAVVGRGEGHSKKEAEQMAAKDALEKLTDQR